MPQLEVERTDRDVYAQRLRRATEAYLYRVRLIAYAQARSATNADPAREQSAPKHEAA